jgi:hypothetical protein
LDFTAGKLTLKKSEQTQLTTSPALILKKNENLGCRRNIVWKDCSKVDNSVILDLYKVQTIEQARELIQNEKFKAYRNEMDKNVDKSFYS